MLLTPRQIDFIAAALMIVIGGTSWWAMRASRTEKALLGAATVPSALLVGMAISADPVGPGGVGNASYLSILGVVLYALLVVALIVIRLDFRRHDALRVALALTTASMLAMIGLAAYAEPKLPPFHFNEANLSDVNPI